MELTEEEARAEGKQMEVIVGQQLSHPNIVKALGSGTMRMKVATCTPFCPIQRDPHDDSHQSLQMLMEQFKMSILLPKRTGKPDFDVAVCWYVCISLKSQARYLGGG